jgi:hypothetical protein
MTLHSLVTAVCAGRGQAGTLATGQARVPRAQHRATAVAELDDLLPVGRDDQPAGIDRKAVDLGNAARPLGGTCQAASGRAATPGEPEHVGASGAAPW